MCGELIKLHNYGEPAKPPGEGVPDKVINLEERRKQKKANELDKAFKTDKDRAAENSKYILEQKFSALEENIKDSIELGTIRTAIVEEPLALFSGELALSPAAAKSLDSLYKKLIFSLEKQGISDKMDRDTALIGLIHDAAHDPVLIADCPRLFGGLDEAIEAENMRKSEQEQQAAAGNRLK